MFLKIQKKEKSAMVFFQHKSEIGFCALCDAMLEDFALPDLNDENKDLHLRLGDFIAELGLLA